MRVGEEQIRTYQLIAALNTLDLGAGSVRLRYVQDAWKNRVRLHMQTERMTTEYQWRMMGDESVGAFKKALWQAIAIVLPHDAVRDVAEIDLYDYENLAQQCGLTWALEVL